MNLDTWNKYFCISILLIFPFRKNVKLFMYHLSSLTLFVILKKQSFEYVDLLKLFQIVHLAWWLPNLIVEF